MHLSLIVSGWFCLKKTKQNSSELDVLSHFLVPKSSIITNSEKEKLLKQLSINDTQLPRINSSDPLVVSLKANVGDIIKLVRNDGTGDYTAYRIVH